MRLRRADRITIDALGFDLRPAPTFDRVVDPNDQFTTRSKGRAQHSQQHLSGSKRRPTRAIEHAVIILIALVLAVARHAQTSGDGPFADGQNGADQQGLGAFPNLVGEKRRKFYNHRQQLGRQYWHTEDLSWR